MELPARARAGLALVGVGYLLWLPNMLAFDAVSAGITALQALALLGAAALLARGDGGRGGAAGLLVLGAAATWGSFAMGLDGQLTTANSAFGALGWTLVAWYAVRGATEPAPGAAWLRGMRLGLLTMALGFAGWMVYNLGTMTVSWMPGNLAGIAGALLFARAVPATPRHATDPARRTAPEGAPEADAGRAEGS